MDLGPHGTFIAASYAFTILIVGGLIAMAVTGARSQARRLAELESRGARRRSADGSAPATAARPVTTGSQP